MATVDAEDPLVVAGVLDAAELPPLPQPETNAAPESSTATCKHTRFAIDSP